ncbi:MAG TPA: hypothetical protein VKH41_11915 [Myxococcota bacterium]|nr:hypothetical protein [Myxococcota bacterium]
MRSLHPLHPLRSAFAAALLLGPLGSTPAHAASFTVFWDRADFGMGAGLGVSATTAQNAGSAGIAIVPLPGLFKVPTTLVIDHAADPSTLVVPVPIGIGPATITADWSATNNTGVNNGSDPAQNLYLVYRTPVTNDEHSPSVTYAPSDVGITLRSGEGGLDWVILQVPSDPFDPGSIPVYYPAVSLGTLANGATAAFPLLYTLDDPQVFSAPFNFELGMPKWSLSFASRLVVVPEPPTGLLVLAGLLGIAGGRAMRS